MRSLHISIQEQRVTNPPTLRFIAGLLLVLAAFAPPVQAHPPSEHPAEAMREEPVDTGPQAQEAARGVAGADASTRGRAVGSLLAGEIADDAAIKRPTAVLRVMRCIMFLLSAGA